MAGDGQWAKGKLGWMMENGLRERDEFQKVSKLRARARSSEHPTFSFGILAQGPKICKDIPDMQNPHKKKGGNAPPRV